MPVDFLETVIVRVLFRKPELCTTVVMVVGFAVVRIMLGLVEVLTGGTTAVEFL